jgi:hypothetical protein
MSRVDRLLRWLGRHRGVLVVLLALELSAALVVGVSSLGAQEQTVPANDLQNLLALTGVPTPPQAPVQDNAQPVLAASPRAVCGPGSKPLSGVQGRVPASAIDSPAAAAGWTCNLATVGHFASPGGFRVWRYVDRAGHACAYYDTSLFSPLNVVSLVAGPSPGVEVLDMSDPAHPVRTAVLTSLPMLFPHESLNLNTRRGLLAADMGNGATLPGLTSVYDVGHDCRHPVLDSTFLAARFGHESGFSPDGKTFYIGGGLGIAAVDVSNPTHPHTVWEGNVYAHGLNVSDDGNTLYDSDPINGNLVTLNVSQIQARRPNPVVTEISRLTWDTVSVPQNTNPMQIGGHRYLLEFDEFAFRFTALPGLAEPFDQVGGARIINIDNASHPRVVSNLRLAVNMPAEHKAADSDPSPVPTPLTTYAAHYCGIPREVDPEIVACSFINSGLRIFNIQDPLHPREVAYYVSPPKAATVGGALTGDFAMSQPAFDPARREVWYTDSTSGFYVLRLDQRVWPNPTKLPGLACAPPSGSLRGRTLGPVRLGEPRLSARAAFARFTVWSHPTFDFFCFAGGPGIRVAYPSVALLRRSPKSRRRVRGRAILLLTANRHYALGGVRPGARLSAVKRRLHLSKPFKVGLNTWYLVPGSLATGMLKVRHGTILEVGIADKPLTAGRTAAVRFLNSLW